MEKWSLNGKWSLEYEGQKTEICVPSAVETVMEDRSFYGPFYYQKEFELKECLREASCVLDMQGVSYACRVFCNGKEAGAHEGIWDPFRIDLTELVISGKNTLTVEVQKPDFDKESPYFFRSVLFGFIPDILLPFGGIWKDAQLCVLGSNYFDRAEILFDTEASCVRILSGLHREAELGTELEIVIRTPEGECLRQRCGWEAEICVPVAEPVCWSPEAPKLYQAEVSLMSGEKVLDRKSRRGGFRCISVENGEILLNGKPFYMRGILHWGCYPDKMMPCPSREEIREELRKLRNMGFNTVKHCLYFPPEDYYELCDELGFVVWQELPLWLPYPNRWLDDRVYTQYPRMLDLFLPHPCVTLVSLGCELDSTISAGMLKDLYRMVRQKDTQVIICDNSGSGECFGGVQEADSDIYDYHFYGELYQMEQLLQEFTRSSRKVKPWLFGEFNDCDTFRLVKQEEGAWWTSPDERVNLLRQVHKGFGSDQPVYRQAEILEEYGIRDRVAGLEELSIGQMQEVRKFLLELTRSYEKFKGYNITTIQDVPITTAGLLDEEGNPKLPDEEMQKINGEVVITLQKELKRVWDRGADRFYNTDFWNHFSGEAFHGTAVVSNRSGRALEGKAAVSLEAEGHVVYEMEFPCRVEGNHTGEIGRLEVPLPEVDHGVRCRLSIEIHTEDTCISNDWEIWVYPKVSGGKLYLLDHSGSFRGIENFFDVKRLGSRKEAGELEPGAVLLTTEYDRDLEEQICQGVCVIAVIRQGGAFPVEERPFFREGVKEILPHPVLDGLAHKGFAGIQFYGLAPKLCLDPIRMDQEAGNYRPLIRRVDARKFMAEDYLAEIRYGKGRLLATTLNLDGGVGDQPVWFSENRLAVVLLDRMLAYLQEETT